MSISSIRGFTLIELMIVIVIVSILAAIALPAYNDSVRKTRRADCKATLLNIAQAQERHFSRFLQYADNITGNAAAANDLGLGPNSNLSEEGFCTVASNSASATQYVLTGTITPADPDCTTLTIDQLGAKGETGGLAGQDLCW